MTVQTSWDNEDHTIIRTEFVGAWTWEEAHQAVDQMVALIESVDYTVHTIVDVTNSSRVPSLAFKEVRSLLSRRHPRAGVSMIVGANFMTASLWKTIAQTYAWLINGNYHFADTLEEARARIAASINARR
jgi:hypothetical protein